MSPAALANTDTQNKIWIHTGVIFLLPVILMIVTHSMISIFIIVAIATMPMPCIGFCVLELEVVGCRDGERGRGGEGSRRAGEGREGRGGEREER